MKYPVRLLGSVFFLFLVPQIILRAQEATITKTNLKIGEIAPDFTLLDNKWEPVSLNDFRGKKNVILIFYVLAFSPN